MTEPTAAPHSAADADRNSPPPMPRWVKVAAIVVGVLVALFVIAQLAGIGGNHGPGRHLSGSSIPLQGVTGEATAVTSGLRG